MWTSLPNAIVLAFVTFAVSLSLAKVFGKKFGYSIDSNQVSLVLLVLLLTCSYVLVHGHSKSEVRCSSCILIMLQ